MQHLSIEQCADYLEGAIIDSTIDTGYAVTHIGRNAAGVGFVMMNDACGNTTVSEAI